MTPEHVIVERIKRFNAVMSRALSYSFRPLQLDDLEINVLSCHRSLQNSNHITPEHEHPNYELTFMEVGEMVSFCEGNQVICRAGDNHILFIPPAILHHRAFGAEPQNINLSLVFTVTGDSAESSAVVAKLARIIQDRKYCFELTPELAAIAGEMTRQADNDPPLAAIAARHLLYGFLAIFFQQSAPELFEPAARVRLLDRFDFENNRVAVIKRVLTNLVNTGGVNLKAAKIFGMSPRHLNRIFKAETGMTITKYQLKQKISHAETLLNGTDISMKEIAHALGFASPARFSVFFQKHHGCTPTHFRRMNRSGN